MLDFRKLAGALRSGQDGWRLGRATKREAFRLEALMRRILHAALKK